MLVPMRAWLAAMGVIFALLPARASGPEISADRVVNAADRRAGGVAPSEVVVLYPTNAGPPEMVPWSLDPMHMGQYSLDSLGGTRVLFDEVAAPMVYARSGEICAIVPGQVRGKKSTELVVEYQGERSAPVTLPVVASAPALFTLDGSGVGQAAMLNDTGCCNSPRNPAMRGKGAVLYATGEGLPLPGSPERTAMALPLQVTVGGVPAEILWTGNVGVLQINFMVPANAPSGDAVPLFLTVGNTRSTAAVTMAVRSAQRGILLMTSDAAVRRRLTEILTPAGYDVLSAPDEASLKLLPKGRNIDLAIAGLDRTAGANLQMLAEIRKDHQLVKTAVLAGEMNDGTLKTADLLGAQAVLTKPLSARTVLDKVRTLVERRPARY